MKTIILSACTSLLARVFFNQKNFDFLEVGPYDYKLTEKDLSFETENETAEEEYYTPGALAFG